jgi:hypothetical protein
MLTRLIARWRMDRFFGRAIKSPGEILSEEALERFASDEGPEIAGAFAARWIENPAGGSPDAPTVLCLYRLQFAKDIVELRKRTALRWIAFKAGPLSAARFLGRLQKTWVPDAIRAQTDFMVATGPDAERARERTLRFGRAFLKALRGRVRVDAVMSANVDYWQEDGILRACEEIGVPFLVLCREMAVQPLVFDGLVEYYREKGFRFGGAAVALGAQMQFDALAKAGVCRPDQMAVTGLPRFDAWRDAPDATERRLVTLISFSDPRYGAADAFGELLELFAEESAREGCSGLYVVKCKGRADAEVCRAMLGEERAARLLFEIERPVAEIYSRSALIIGFNSTALVEAVLSGATVAVPAWGGALVPPRGCLVDPADPLASRVIRFAGNLDAVRGWARKAVSGDLVPDPGAKRLAHDYFRSFYCYPETGSCSAMVEAFVRERVSKPGY